MAPVAFLTLCALQVATRAVSLSDAREAGAVERAYELSAHRAMMGATSFLHGLESDLARLSEAFGPHSGMAALVQLDSETSAPKALQPAAVKPAAAKPAAAKPAAAKPAAAKPAAAKPAAAKLAEAKPAAAKPTAATPALRKKAITATEAVKEMDKLKPSQMPAMLGLLTGMYDSWKDKIGEANKKEQEQKSAYEATIKDLEAKKKAANGSQDAGATYDRIEKYWKRQRAISHRQYHTALKIMHAGMQKFKAVSSAMGNAIAGKKPSHKDMQTVGMAMPDVVFLQRSVRRLAVWTQGATADLHDAERLAVA